jgi:hypothetical protein
VCAHTRARKYCSHALYPSAKARERAAKSRNDRLVFSTGKSKEVPLWFAAPNECSWKGVTCSNGRIVKVEIYDAFMKGTIPPDVALWTSLTVFGLGRNQLSGSLPVEIGRWSNINVMDVGGNFLTGKLPTSIGRWTGISFFNVGTNSLSGTLPTEMGVWSGMTNFYADKNGFQGKVPPGIATWTNLREFRIHATGLTGTIPAIGNNVFCPRTEVLLGLPRATYMWADCKAVPPFQIVCGCCSTCCDVFGESCTLQQ